MALLLIEGFDDGLATSRPYTKMTSPISSTYGRTGDGIHAGDVANTGWAISVAAYSADTTFTVGMALKVVQGGNHHLFQFANETDDPQYKYNVSVCYDVSGNRFYVQDRSGNTYAATNTAYLDTWYYLEFQVLISNGAGTIELHQDGVTAIPLTTGRDTLNVANLYLVMGGSNTYWVDDYYMDDFYFLDSTGTTSNDFLGICKVETLLPSGNGTSSDMLGSDANSTDNYLLVDNNAAAPPATTEYVGSSMEGDTDTYAMDDLSGTTAVRGVQASLYAAKTDSGAKYMRPVIRSGTTDYAGTSAALSDGTYAAVDETWDEDPNTSTTWAYTAVNAMEVGQEVRDS